MYDDIDQLIHHAQYFDAHVPRKSKLYYYVRHQATKLDDTALLELKAHHGRLLCAKAMGKKSWEI